MPVSDVGNLTPIANYIMMNQPKSILDLGIGMGKYGAIAREILDFTYGRFNPKEWKALIVGYEGFPEYMNAMWDLYNHVHVDDFARFAHDEAPFGNFDLVLMIDSLEHLDMDTGVALLNNLRRHNKKVLVSCPDGDYAQGAVFGNEYERHRSVWDWKTMCRHGGTVIHRGVCSVAIFDKG